MRAVEPEDLLALKTAGDVQLHPTGSRVAFVLNEIDSASDELRSSVWIVETAPGGGREGGASSRRAGRGRGLKPGPAKPGASRGAPGETAPPAGRRTGTGWPSSPTGRRTSHSSTSSPPKGGSAAPDRPGGGRRACRVVAGRDAPGLRRPGAPGVGPRGRRGQEALGAAPAGGLPGPLQDGRDGLQPGRHLAPLRRQRRERAAGRHRAGAGGGPDHVRRGRLPRPGLVAGWGPAGLRPRPGRPGGVQPGGHLGGRRRRIGRPAPHHRRRGPGRLPLLVTGRHPDRLLRHGRRRARTGRSRRPRLPCPRGRPLRRRRGTAAPHELRPTTTAARTSSARPRSRPARRGPRTGPACSMPSTTRGTSPSSAPAWRARSRSRSSGASAGSPPTA